MKIFLTCAFLCLLQVIAGDLVTYQKPEHQVQQHESGHQGPEINSHQQGPLTSEQQHVVLHVTEKSTTTTTPIDSKVSVEIPPKVQQIVTQVSQHIPQVIGHHVANKQRVMRSVKNPQDWREMQVNAVNQPGKCEYMCHEKDTTVCGYNGRCYWQFVSQCDLSTYNCLNTEKIFHVVDFAKCQDIGAAKCYRGDM